MRLFTALDLPDFIKDELVALKHETLTGARWTKPEQWHITLHFIGEVADDTAIREALQSVNGAGFTLRLNGVGTFGAKKKPRVLWAGIETSDAIHALHLQIGQALTETGFTPDRRNYHPHLTLARFKHSHPSTQNLSDYLAEHEAFSTQAFNVANFTLYQSTLTPSGAIYDVIERYNLTT